MENQHAAHAERSVAHASVEQELSQVWGGKVFGGGAGINNLMHAVLMNRGGKPDQGRINEFSIQHASLCMLFRY